MEVMEDEELQLKCVENFWFKQKEESLDGVAIESGLTS